MSYAVAGKLAGLGKSYEVTLPVIGRTTVDFPVDQLAHDFIDAAKADMRQRIVANWPTLAGVGALVVAGIVLWRVRRRP